MSTFRLPLSLVLLAVLGCGESTTAPADMAITFDARPQPDLGPPDLGPVPPGPGTACASDEDCAEGGYCLSNLFGGPLADGYCSADCTSDEDCGESGYCAMTRGGGVCLGTCDPADTASCRDGYGCGVSYFGADVCLPGCQTDAECGEGSACDPFAGDWGVGGCYDTDSQVGDPCSDTEQCPESGYCVDERFQGWPAGYCGVLGCDPEADTGCDEGDHCAFELSTGGGGSVGLCAKGCETDDDCRTGYACEPASSHPDRMVCQPACQSDSMCSVSGNVCNAGLGTCDEPFVSGQLGDSCNFSSGGCTGGTCLREFDYGFPGALCSYLGCTVGPDAEDGCPDDGVCAERGGSTLCFASCGTDDDCRDGYACRAVDAADATRGMGCFPACESADDCANDEFACNVGTGLCTEPYSDALLGEPCENTSDDCTGGRCLSEAGAGWPAGTCTADGCALTGDVTGAACPAAGVCVDDGDADDFGYCLVACTVATTSCRPGYACEALEGSATEGACQPACTTGDCGTGFVCNDTTGLCETD